MRLTPFVLAGLLTAAGAASAQQFVYSPSTLPQQQIWTDGVELADVDGDTDIDILFANGGNYATNTTAVQQLFLNNGNGTFSAAHGNLNIANFNAKQVIANDYDGDGDLDLVYALHSSLPATQRPRILINNGNGVFADETLTRMPAVPLVAFGVCAGDVDNDRDLDLVVTDGGTFGGIASQARLFLNNGAGVFSDATATHMPADLYNAQDVVLLDFDGDFDIDIALSGKGSSGKRARLYLNDGTGHFAISNILNNLGNNSTYEIDWAELDGDGFLDGVVQSISGASEGWAKNNNGTSISTAVFPAPNGIDDNEMGALDYDDDGDLDVFVCSLGATERAYRNNGNGTFTSVNSIIQAVGDSSLDFGFADLDGNGTYDMVTGQGESGSFFNKVYFNNGPADTTKPRLIRIETPSLASPATTARVTLSDAIQDDGKINVTVRALYGTAGGAGQAAIVPGFHQGSGTFQVAVPATAQTTDVSVGWIARDASGNTTTYGPVATGVNPWTDLGFGTNGTHGQPELIGVGTLQPDTPGVVALVSARGNAPAVLFIGLTQANLPLIGATLVPSPDLALAVLTNAAGELPIVFPAWPNTIAPGTAVYMQYVIGDPEGAHDVAFSNAIRGISQ